MNTDTPVSQIFRLTSVQKNALKKLGIEEINDLLYHFPVRYGDTSEVKNIKDLLAGENAVVFGKISGLKTSKAFRKKIPMAEGSVEDGTARIKIIWFNQPYIAKMLNDSALVRIEGKVSKRRNTGERYFSNPKIEKVAKLPTGVGHSLFGQSAEEHSLYPIYPESRGITSNWFYHVFLKIFSSNIIGELVDPIPDEILKKYNLPKLASALIWIHSPKRQSDAFAARKRFSFEEVFFIQLEKQRQKIEYQNNPTYKAEIADSKIKNFLSRFPFLPTKAQVRAIDVIIENFKGQHAMSRLLEGDVGSGKTLIAAVSAYVISAAKANGQSFANLQVAYMAPTEILAIQHFESFIQYFSHLPVNIALITGSGCRKFPSKVNPSSWTNISRSQLLKWVEGGEISILIGTHALIQKSVKFKHLAFVIIDEQHRFGTNQRQKLVLKENRAPHLLTMTATPIPRTLALTIYGDLDLTLVDESPPGRKQIITEIVRPEERKNVYEKIRKEIKAGRQAFVICPRIEEPDPLKELALMVKSVKAEAKRLMRDVFPEFAIAVLHGKMSPANKDKTIKEFEKGAINILCATSVVEVGVNIPNATLIVIEGAERFGLAQLHQLRGRVLRSSHQAYCYIFADNSSAKTFERLKALKTAKNGFELAELDLKLRGAGSLLGLKQWGITDMAMEALQNLKMVEAARQEAKNIIEVGISKFPLLEKKLLLQQKSKIHFE